MVISVVAILFAVLINTCSTSYLTTCGKRDNEEKNIYNRTEYSEIGPPLLYHDVGTVLEFLQKPEYENNSDVQAVLECYQRAKDKKEKFDRAGGSKRHPLIVLEGISGTGKTTVSKGLIKKINGKTIHSLPVDLKHLRRSVRNNSVLDIAFLVVGNYIGGLEAHQMLNDSPLVMDRYWHSSAVHAIATAINNYPEKYQMPPEGDKVYNWPEDLLTPDLVMLLSVDEDMRQQRLIRRRNFLGKPEKPDSINKFIKTCPQFLENKLIAYKRMRKPGVAVINGNPSEEEVLADVYSKVTPLFGNR